ncbi:electron transfer flavoprotein subunit beta/FixA family protein [Paenibacillus motobuensis]|uniref:electron transfer flavoprotein subunit beta/FixA family protein n=1 Tax=Paenibacillus TaxID=44249 RepID=UPI00203E67C3|nr:MULTISPECIES: electron transfer flavoprotein subunit beta/FixA family protein [Paenibacillus]MCM3039891.1 electron transfer flavoprotein subunit beta/FixA family protein [Paenibacillus lutimineralis]MCM3646995.1 electron transfer flavoprotein subunit beta/FixA family protein [Paenibacillus motobuensis]
MNIFVILKQTFDTEEKISIQNGKIAEDCVKFIINPYDEYAVEEALRQKEQHGGSVTVISVGPARVAEALRTALAMGADEAVLIQNDDSASDEFTISSLLAAYFRDQAFDLILGGYFSVDNGAGQTAVRLARLLDVPHASAITHLQITSNQATVTRDAEGDTETIEIRLPALFTAQQGLNEPRYPSLPGIMKAKKKPFLTLEPQQLNGIEAEIAPRTVRTSLSLPAERKSGRILLGTIQEQTVELIHLLRNEDKVI